MLVPQFGKSGGDGMAQVQQVERIHRKKAGRWMPTDQQARAAAVMKASITIAGQAGAAFLLCFSDVMGIPSGLQAGWLTALSAAGESLLWPACGCLLAYPMRLLWGLSPRWETLLSLGLLLCSPKVVFHGKAWRLSLWTALTLLPCLVFALPHGVAADTLLALGTVVTGTLAAPVMLRAIRALRRGDVVDALDERVAISYSAALILAGGGRLMLFGVNLGALGASFLALYAGLCLGVGAGCVMGVVAGTVLAMQGLPLGFSVCLGIGGFLTGIVAWQGHRRLSCLCFGIACATTMLLAGAGTLPFLASTSAASLASAFLPESVHQKIEELFQRFRTERSDVDACCAQLLARWQQTMANMANAVPKPQKRDDTHDEAWWKSQLCAGCTEEEHCPVMEEALSIRRAERTLADYALPDAQWQASLEGLRGLGCARLYQLRERMEQLRRERFQEDRLLRKAAYEQEMLATHLTAMAGAARRFALLAAGGSWWDVASARQLQQAASEAAIPAALLYVRRVGGHAQVAWELRRTGEDVQQTLCRLTGQVLDVSMQIVLYEHERLTLEEQPPLTPEVGQASRGMLEQSAANGDAFYCGTLSGGTGLVIVSDGMGHGERAREESAQTVTLLRLCLEAGYTRAQALCAVNGMMLSATRGERFATADVALLNLWNGQCTLDKLGAADSWLMHDGVLTRLSGEALPLGVMEEIASRTCMLRLFDGDTLLLLTDGVEDAFPSTEAFQAALAEAVACSSAQEAAELLVQSVPEPALMDDRTALVIRVHRK